MKDAAREVFGEQTQKIRKPWISKDTIDLIDKQQEHRNKQEYTEEWETTKQVKKQARKDKKQWITKQLEEHSQGHPAEQWKGIKFLKKPGGFKNTVLKYNGKIVLFFERAEGLATHLTEKQWGKNPEEDNNKAKLEAGEVINTCTTS